LNRQAVREFLTWVYEKAVEGEGSNPGRTANKARENLRAVMSWAWEQDLIDSLPRFPPPRPQRDVAGRHYLTKLELNALYFATHQMKRPRGWNHPLSIGHYWRSALVLFFNYGLDTGTLWRTMDCHEPIRWRHVFWERVVPNGQHKEQSRWGWLFYKRVKTGKTFYRPMNRVVHAHLRSLLLTEEPDPNAPVVEGGGAHPNLRFQALCELAGISPKTDIETGEQKPWVLKDLRKTCATYYDAHFPESSVEILGHSLSGITYRHYAHRDPLAFKAIMTIPQPAAFKGLANGIEGACPCCRRSFS
jgi:integrase